MAAEANLPVAMPLRGALIGLITYATYDLTNFATLRDWLVLLTVVDMVWGTFLTAVTTALAVWLAGVLKF